MGHFPSSRPKTTEVAMAAISEDFESLQTPIEDETHAEIDRRREANEVIMQGVAEFLQQEMGQFARVYDWKVEDYHVALYMRDEPWRDTTWTILPRVVEDDALIDTMNVIVAEIDEDPDTDGEQFGRALRHRADAKATLARISRDSNREVVYMTHEDEYGYAFLTRSSKASGSPAYTWMEAIDSTDPANRVGK